MSEQEVKRPAGRPRQGTSKKQHVDIMLSPEIIQALERATDNKSQFIETLLRRELAERIQR